MTGVSNILGVDFCANFLSRSYDAMERKLFYYIQWKCTKEFGIKNDGKQDKIGEYYVVRI
jgi:hypothetical protein